ncbi:alpha/beta fold hydrolase [Williamsia sp. D3]|uniref:alpha/beta fold hydrolase n=1 Tax=Williamsia sp. D3 TaxID=1313067 RepID=UPI00068598C8|nr:alpha/beta fold hydrolase [Williamsia sp. D3]
MTTQSRAVLLCGVAVDPPVWEQTSTVLSERGFHVVIPQRPRSGDLAAEVEFLAPLCDDAVVFGVSGGATLGLELAARGVTMTAAVLHEPAAGSLMPGLLDPVVAAFDEHGVPGFGHELYGPGWDPSMTTSNWETVARELAMFRRFEPRPLTINSSSVTLTVGAKSPRVRHESVNALAGALDLKVRVLPGTSHAAHLDNAFAPLIEELEPMVHVHSAGSR